MSGWAAPSVTEPGLLVRALVFANRIASASGSATSCRYLFIFLILIIRVWSAVIGPNKTPPQRAVAFHRFLRAIETASTTAQIQKAMLQNDNMSWNTLGIQ